MKFKNGNFLDAECSFCKTSRVFPHFLFLHYIFQIIKSKKFHATTKGCQYIEKSRIFCLKFSKVLLKKREVLGNLKKQK